MRHHPENVSGNFLKLRNKLISATGKAIGDYNMISDGDTLLVCMSGGKDSHALLMMLLALQERAPVDFKLIAMNLDQKQPGFPEHVLPAYLDTLGVDYRIVEADTYSVVKEKVPEGKTTCSLCSRLRRGIIYRTAQELGCNKIALGHHRDDIVQTLFLNMFFGAKLKAMPPKLATDKGEFVVIRPLAYCAEKDIAAYARGMEFPIIPCDLCGSQENLQRQNIKRMLAQWEQEYPGRTEKIFRALGNVAPSHLADTELFDFKSIAPKADEDDPLFGDLDQELALNLAGVSGNRIEFVRATEQGSEAKGQESDNPIPT
ncbi:MAG: tRNA 2-thiocytidine(32) synthetase TtcA [Methylobacillus sp.]|jgi:tRNA 2-thiocytidine biosynthesis protein TtcA|nr:tRNA 2-thiocytidine(32) synthetase TtcA [Methylobacillus sp.]